MSGPLSVLQKAERLQAEARRLNEGAKGEEEARRISERIIVLRTHLVTLQRHLRIARSLMTQPASPDIDLSGIDSGLAAFSRQCEGGGLPPNAAFTRASTAVQKTAQRIAQDSQEAWRQWTQTQLTELELARQVMLSIGEQSRAKSLHQDLVKAARTAEVDASAITLFANAHAELAELLSTAPAPPPELQTLLDRLASGTSQLLKDITDAEIALLRQCQLDGDLEVRRRRA
ncbi:hypothetical protein [Streptomyces griseoflavus]|uniref:Uncharacterized protein n=1 Tax=Streptomyces griseoflavus Tu4000 TaxID=467200 RepID=D9XKW4_9ACTN|nr:hypothetical protein [Streptomyces griseoflavus]EFL39110.1 hypothetical protein SSRG_01914 [Streptomyces griseoflavus Tu4000]